MSFVDFLAWLEEEALLEKAGKRLVFGDLVVELWADEKYGFVRTYRKGLASLKSVPMILPLEVYLGLVKVLDGKVDG